MIVRDEADFLAECLAQLQPLNCTVVVVDTGSSDDTVAIARRHGCVLDTFAWCDDFAAARNAALARCETPWIFVLDADERIATEDLQALGVLAAGTPDRAYRIVTRNYTHRSSTGEFTPCAPGDPFGRGFAGWFPSAKVRLFPNRPNVRFSGQVHELVNASLAREGIPVVDSGVVVHHYGLAREAARLHEKQVAYLRLGLAKAEAEPANAQAFAELGHQYLELDDLPNALRAYKRAVGLAPAHGIFLADLGAALHLAGRKDEARAALQLAVERAEGHVDAWRNLGVLHAEAGTWAAALHCFKKAAALNPSQGELRRYLALALAECGDLTAAVLEAHAAVELSPGDAQARSLHEDLKRRSAELAR
jgi:Flp pilus assembly protein TadD